MNEPNENLIADAVVDAVRKHLPYGAVDNVYWGGMWQEIRREARSHLSSNFAALREENARLWAALEEARSELETHYHSAYCQLPVDDDLWGRIDAALSTPAAERESVPEAARVELGVIELHPKAALRDDFYRVADDLRRAGCIVDVWLMDIATTLKRHGYRMEVYRESAAPKEPK